MTTLLPA